jgi:glucosylceramidase
VASPVTPEADPNLATTGSTGTVAEVWLTTPDQAQLLATQSDVKFASDRGSAALTIDVDEATRYQEITGFGAAITGSTAYVMQNMTEVARQTLIDKLFHAERGIGLSLVRLGMGATDFSLSSYTYNDLPQGETDPELTKFSIEAGSVRQLRAVLSQVH